MRRFGAFLALTLLVGCTEGTKPDPLRRAGTVAPPPVEAKDPKAKPAEAPTLYKRLGEEEGLMKVAAMALAEPEAKKLAEKLTVPRLGSLLVEASSADGLTDPPPLSAAQWDTLVQVLRTAMVGRGIEGADRDELLTRLMKGKR